jgi:uncharacterized integral membrane protein
VTPFQWSLTVWAGIWATQFLVFEALAWRDKVPWNTLSWTIWQLSARSTMVAMAVTGGMFILTLHFAFGFPNRGRFKREDTEGDR